MIIFVGVAKKGDFQYYISLLTKEPLEMRNELNAGRRQKVHPQVSHLTRPLLTTNGFQEMEKISLKVYARMQMKKGKTERIEISWILAV